MPSVNSSSVPKVCDSSTVMTPSLPTLSKASAMRPPISSSRAEVLVRVVELDVPGDGHPIVGDGGGTPLLVQDDVAPLRAEGDLHGVGEDVDPALQGAPRLLVELKDLCHRCETPYLVTTARMSRALSRRSSLPSYLTSVPPYLLKITTSPSATSSGTRLPLSSTRPGPVASTLPSCGFSLAVSGMTRPEAVVCSASSGSTRMRSSSGLIVTDTSNPFHSVYVRMFGDGRNVVAVPLRPSSPVGWHTPGESANPTLALCLCECQQRSGAGQPSRSTTRTTAPAGVR